MSLFKMFLVMGLLLSVDLSWAEPWLANRYAQNCAGCHAPGRLNRKPSKRRCTLSCQGCHVNPNGGGLRNQYGKWNEERWLRSFYTDLAWNKKSTAPLNKQHYAQFGEEHDESEKGSSKKKGKKKVSDKKRMLTYAKRGANLVGFKGVVQDESPYFESSNYTAARNMVEELSRMTKDDPYRLERQNMVTAGGDLRFFWIQQSDGAASDKLKDGTFFPMVFDFGVRVRPIKEKVSFVYEGRAVNTRINEPSSIDNLFGSNGVGITRSAYLLIDDLWYNSYFQYGFFRPMFGLYNANHNAMITDYTQLGIRTRIKGAGIGLAPNVPFGIFNMILPTEGAATGDISAEEGFNATLGLRFVRFGANLTGTYWSSQNDKAAIPTKRQMWNVNAGAVLLHRRLILNGEITSVHREAFGLDETKIIGVEGRFRFWRQMYLQTSLTQANAAVARNVTTSGTGISPGSGSEATFGLRSFWFSGFETELLMAEKINKEDGFDDYKENTMSFQMHAYF